MANVIATIPGKRRDRLVLASHFDTKLYREFRFVGANDGASSTAALLELARVLKQRQNEFTIELLFLDGEEARMPEWRGLDNTYGSRHYVDAARTTKTLSSLKALVLLDMIGDRELKIRRDANSTPWLVDILWAAAAKLGHSGTFSNELTTIEDDHVPFLRAGVPAVDLIDLENPTWHTPQDTLDFVSARSLQIVGDVVLAALPDIEKRLAAGKSGISGSRDQERCVAPIPDPRVYSLAMATLTLKVNGRSRTRGRRPSDASAVRPQRRPRAARAEVRLRSRPVRVVHRDLERSGHPIVRHAGQLGDERRDHDARRPRHARETAPDSAGVHRRAGRAVRLLPERRDADRQRRFSTGTRARPTSRFSRRSPACSAAASATRACSGRSGATRTERRV